jgi:hypothetical protein
VAIPEEDLGRTWLGDYGAIEADIQRMEEFAAKLRAEVTNNYAPHFELVAHDMTTGVPQPDARFGELVGFLQAHQVTQVNTTNAIMYHGNETGGFAEAASKISQNYGAADAFAHARVSVVERALDEATTVPAPPAGRISVDPAVAGPSHVPSSVDSTRTSTEH